MARRIEHHHRADHATVSVVISDAGHVNADGVASGARLFASFDIISAMPLDNTIPAWMQIATLLYLITWGGFNSFCSCSCVPSPQAGPLALAAALKC